MVSFKPFQQKYIQYSTNQPQANSVSVKEGFQDIYTTKSQPHAYKFWLGPQKLLQDQNHKFSNHSLSLQANFLALNLYDKYQLNEHT